MSRTASFEESEWPILEKMDEFDPAFLGHVILFLIVMALAARPAEPIDCRWSAREEPGANLLCDPETDRIMGARIEFEFRTRRQRCLIPRF